jgi:hypothetical protein
VARASLLLASKAVYKYARLHRRSRKRLFKCLDIT